MVGLGFYEHLQNKSSRLCCVCLQIICKERDG
jgi:hypothetical protein